MHPPHAKEKELAASDAAWACIGAAAKAKEAMKTTQESLRQAAENATAAAMATAREKTAKAASRAGVAQQTKTAISAAVSAFPSAQAQSAIPVANLSSAYDSKDKVENDANKVAPGTEGEMVAAEGHQLDDAADDTTFGEAMSTILCMQRHSAADVETASGSEQAALDMLLAADARHTALAVTGHAAGQEEGTALVRQTKPAAPSQTAAGASSITAADSVAACDAEGAAATAPSQC